MYCLNALFVTSEDLSIGFLNDPILMRRSHRHDYENLLYIQCHAHKESAIKVHIKSHSAHEWIIHYNVCCGHNPTFFENWLIISCKNYSSVQTAARPGEVTQHCLVNCLRPYWSEAQVSRRDKCLLIKRGLQSFVESVWLSSLNPSSVLMGNVYLDKVIN